MADPQQRSEVRRDTERFSFRTFAGYCSVCIAISLLTIILLLSVLFVIFEVPHGLQTLTLRGLVADVFTAVFMPLIGFTADIIKSLFPWPILVILSLLLLTWGPDRIREMFSSANIELPGGFKYRGGATAPDVFKKEMGDAQKVVEKANREIKEAYDSAQVYAAQLRERHKIDKLVGDLSSQIARIIGHECPDDYRLTLYVPDLVFSDRLYQLTEYFDKDGRVASDGKLGRAFSIRYGIIGRVWRSGVEEVEGELISADDRKELGQTPDGRELDRFIARRWGLTLDEAMRIRPYQSYGAIRLEGGEKPVGVIFFDSKTKNAFGDANLVQAQVKALVLDSILTLSLLEISREISPWSRIQIFRKI